MRSRCESTHDRPSRSSSCHVAHRCLHVRASRCVHRRIQTTKGFFNLPRVYRNATFSQFQSLTIVPAQFLSFSRLATVLSLALRFLTFVLSRKMNKRVIIPISIESYSSASKKNRVSTILTFGVSYVILLVVRHNRE